MIDVFYFPEDNRKLQPIYDKYKIEKCFIYQNLTDTDSTPLFFGFVCGLSCQLNEKDLRNVTFKVMISSIIFERLDLSDEFWTQFSVRNLSLKKQVGLYEIESINNANIVTIPVNPKEYFEIYKDKSINKKHKWSKKILRDAF